MLKSERKVLKVSILSMLLCVVVFIGSTFAWFTDSASTGVNTITAGNLDLKLEVTTDKGATWNEVSTGTKLFDDSAKWEPGHVEVAYLRITNAGNLAFKYALTVDVANEVPGENEDGDEIKLSRILKFGVVETDSFSAFADRTAAEAAATGALSSDTKSGSMLENDEKYLAIAVAMPSSVDNKANHNGTDIPSIKLGVNVVATQDTVEKDSFDEKYDLTAPLPVMATNHTITLTGLVDADAPTVLKTSDESVSVNIPENTVATDTTLAFDISTTEIQESAVIYNIDIAEVAADGATTEVSQLNEAISVSLKIGKNLENVAVTHTASDNTVETFTEVSTPDALVDETFCYDATAGVITICSDSYSPYKITYDVPDIDLTVKVAQASDLFPKSGSGYVGNTAGGEYKLTADISVGRAYFFKDTTIDLNGHTITCTGSYWSTYGNAEHPTLTFKDSKGGGKIVIGQGGNYFLHIGNCDVVMENVVLDASQRGRAFCSQPSSGERYETTITGKNSKIIGQALLSYTYSDAYSKVDMSGFVIEPRETADNSQPDAAVFHVTEGGNNAENNITISDCDITSKTYIVNASGSYYGLRHELTFNDCTFEALEGKYVKAFNPTTFITFNNCTKLGELYLGSGSRAPSIVENNPIEN